MPHSITKDGKIACRCGATYTPDEFLAAHLGPGSKAALAQARRSKIIYCNRCRKARPMGSPL
jgi:hypothetical protein